MELYISMDPGRTDVQARTNNHWILYHLPAVLILQHPNHSHWFQLPLRQMLQPFPPIPLQIRSQLSPIYFHFVNIPSLRAALSSTFLNPPGQLVLH